MSFIEISALSDRGMHYSLGLIVSNLNHLVLPNDFSRLSRCVFFFKYYEMLIAQLVLSITSDLNYVF
jgi:hypothetical protein